MGIFLLLKREVTGILSAQLDKKLCYHNIDHTLDVIEQAEQIALSEKISPAKEILLLKVAALFHDTGFLYVYTGHEEKSCEIAREKFTAIFADDRNLLVSLGVNKDDLPILLDYLLFIIG